MPPTELHLGQVATELFRRYSTPAKETNALHLHQQAAAGCERVSAFPWRVILDPASGCNLKCPSCAGHEGTLHRGLLTLGQLHTYLRDLFPYLIQVNLFNWGSRFLIRACRRSSPICMCAVSERMSIRTGITCPRAMRTVSWRPASIS